MRSPNAIEIGLIIAIASLLFSAFVIVIMANDLERRERIRRDRRLLKQAAERHSND